MAMENPKVIKKGDQVITNYVDEKTGKIAAYEVGIKLEVSDYSGQWFPAKIVEVDKGEKEVLVHFENWSARFDEWIKMDSNRLRPSPNTNIVKTQFKIGESVEALWTTADGQRYPGVIQNIFPNDYYLVLFDDGAKLKKKYNQIFKLKPATRKSGSGTATGGTSNSKMNAEPVGPNPALPELTPISQFVSSVEQLQTQGTKKNSLQPPPLTPKPTLKKAVGSTPKVQITSKEVALPIPSESFLTPEVPESPVVKKVQRRRRKVPPPPPSPAPSPSPPVLLTPPEVEISVSPASTSSNSSVPCSAVIMPAEEPLSKRKRTVQDYSALLRIRRRFSYHKETGGEEVVKRTRRSRSSPFSEPPELFPERPLPSISTPIPLPSPLEETVESQNEPAPLPPPTEKEKEKEDPVPVSLLSLIPPLPTKPKLKRKFRPFNTARRRAKRKQPIKYVVVDDEEFAAAGGAANLNKLQSGSAPTTPARVNSEAEMDSSAPPTPTSVDTSGVDAGTPPGVGQPGQPETRIIKRRRRRTYAHLQMLAAEAEALTSPTSSNADEPLLKRKRTVHDYSMLLKTRPKFFFDIEAERERPNVLSARKRKSAERAASAAASAVESLSPLLPEASPAATVETPVSAATVLDGAEPKKTSADPLSALPVPAMEMVKNSEPSTPSGDVGPTSIATHRPIRRSSSQFARKSYVSPDEPTVLSSRLSESGLKGSNVTILLEHLEGDYSRRKPESHSSRSAGSTGRRGLLKSLSHGESSKESGGTKLIERRPQLGSNLVDLDYANNSEDEELLDIGYAPDRLNSSPSHITPKPPRKSPVTAAALSSSTLPARPSPAAAQHTSVRREVVRRKSRLPNNGRWWKKKPLNTRRVRISENGETLPPPAASAIPRARKILQKVKRRPGDLLSGLTLKRIKTIRTNLYRQGFRKRIIAEPLSKDVSVDIISCVCGSADEHGLMVQCEYCQCWQHGQCFEIETVTDMPTNYVCEACLHPDNVRSRKPSDFQYDFHKVGKLPRFAFGPAVAPRTTKLFQESNTLIQRLYQVREIIQTSRVHMNIMEAKPDHPKLYQWDKPHATIRETQQERRFNKVYRPLLRRLLYYNRDDPQYVSKLRSKVEAVVKRRSFEERQKAEKRLNEKFPTIFPPPRKLTVIPRASVLPPLKRPAPLSASDKETKRLEAEALRIRKELENLSKPKPLGPTSMRSVSQGVAKIKGASAVTAQGLEAIQPAPGQSHSDEKEVGAVMDSILAIVEAVPPNPAQMEINNTPPSPLPTAATVTQKEVEKPPPTVVFTLVDLGEEAPPEFPDFQAVPPNPAPLEIDNPSPSPLPTTATVTQKEVEKPPPTVVFIPVDLGEEAPPEFPDFPEADADILPASLPAAPSSQSTEVEATFPLPTTPRQESNGSISLSTPSREAVDNTGMTITTNAPPPESGAPSETNEKLNPNFSFQDFNQDLLNLDPSDPKFTTIAEDLVKSCCEEPESLIKTLEDLANGAGGHEGVTDLEGSDSDLINFLDDAFMDTFVVPPLNVPSSSASGFLDPKFMLPPPPPPPPIPSNSSFILPPAPPKLTRLTPELCRGNLILTILDQQRIIDQHLDEIETRVVELEKMRGSDAATGGGRAAALRRISILQAKVKKMMKAFEIMKSIGKKAEHGLHDLIRFDPSRLEDGGSASEHEQEGELNNEETDSVEEEEAEDSDDELEDL